MNFIVQVYNYGSSGSTKATGPTQLIRKETTFHLCKQAASGRAGTRTHIRLLGQQVVTHHPNAHASRRLRATHFLRDQTSLRRWPFDETSGVWPRLWY